MTFFEGLKKITDESEAHYYIFKNIDSLLYAGQFGTVDSILKTCPIDEFEDVDLLAFLAITLAASSKLTERASFRERVRTQMINQVDKMLEGL